jgi:hypothetical protein
MGLGRTRKSESKRIASLTFVGGVRCVLKADDGCSFPLKAQRFLAEHVALAAKCAQEYNVGELDDRRIGTVRQSHRQCTVILRGSQGRHDFFGGS